MEIIDCHSHIGHDWIWGESNFEEYIALANKIGVTTSLLMPSPGQIDYKTLKKRLLCYKYELEKFTYWSEVSEECLSSRIVNTKAFDIISNFKGPNRIFFVPFIHPLLDSPEYLYEINDKYKPVAFKIHGVASGVTPNNFSSDFIAVLKKINIPIIVHTDYSNNINSIQFQNNSYSWATFFLKHDLKGYLTHAARLDKETWKLINNHENLVLGLGPDLLIYTRTNTLKDFYSLPNSDILHLLHDYVNVDRIMFDIDFSWNVIDESKKMDFNMVNRVHDTFGEKDAKRILSLNSKRFFGI